MCVPGAGTGTQGNAPRAGREPAGGESGRKPEDQRWWPPAGGGAEPKAGRAVAQSVGPRPRPGGTPESPEGGCAQGGASPSPVTRFRKWAKEAVRAGHRPGQTCPAGSPSCSEPLASTCPLAQSGAPSGGGINEIDGSQEGQQRSLWVTLQHSLCHFLLGRWKKAPNYRGFQTLCIEAGTRVPFTGEREASVSEKIDDRFASHSSTEQLLWI